MVGMKHAMDPTGVLRIVQTPKVMMTGHSQCGFLFDVTAKLQDITVHAVTFVPGVKDGDYDVWTATESHEHVHQNAKAWTLVAKGTHSGPRGTAFRMPLQRHVHIPRSGRHAFYVSGHNVNAICFSTDSHKPCSAENEDVTIHLGHFKAFPWEGVLSTGPFGHNGMQAFVGSLEYEVLQQPSADHVVQNALKLWDTRPFSDADLIAAGGKRFSVHRSILAAASKQLEEAWRNLPSSQERPVLYMDAPAETVEALLHFIYTGCDSGLTPAGDMLRMAHLYGLPTLVRSASTRLATSMSRQNALESVRALRPYREHTACQTAWSSLLEGVQELLMDDNALLEELCMAI